MTKPLCRECKVNHFISMNACDNKIYFCCGLCGNIWEYNSTILKKVVERDVGRILGKILEERGQVYATKYREEAKEKKETQAKPMSTPTFDWG